MLSYIASTFLIESARNTRNMFLRKTRARDKNSVDGTDKQNALRRECTFKIEIVLEIGVAGVNIYLKITVLTPPDVPARLAQSVRPWRMLIDFYQ